MKTEMKEQMEHTPEPWAFRWESEAHDWAIITDRHGSIVANVNTETGPDGTSVPATRQMPGEANADRIVACVNALAGLPDPSVVPELVTLVCITEDGAMADRSHADAKRRLNAISAACRAMLARIGKATP